MLKHSLGLRRRIVSPVVLFSLSALVVCAGCSSASANRPVDVAAVTQQLIARGDSLSAAQVAEDTARVLPYYADDAIMQPANMRAVTGHAEIGKLYALSFPMVSAQSGDRTKLEVSASGDMAWEHGIRRVTMTGATTPTVGKYAAVWKKVGSEWKIVLLAFSEDAPPSAAIGGKK